MARPRKSAPSVGGTKEIREGLERKGVSVEFLNDLDNYDRTKVDGLPKNIVPRWVRESDIGLRERQGYTKLDGKGLKISAPGGKTHWASEGVQAKTPGRGLVLMGIDKELHDARQAYKQRKRDEHTAAMEDSLRGDMGKGINPEYASVLGNNDSFIKGLKGGS